MDGRFRVGFAVSLLLLGACAGTSPTPAASAAGPTEASPAPTVLTATGTPTHTGSVPPDSSPSPLPPGSGVVGYVIAEPACRNATPPCGAPARPVGALVIAYAAGSNAEAGRTHTRDTAGENDRFVLALPPGTYRLEAHPDDAGIACSPTAVAVGTGYSDAAIGCQEG